MVTHHRISRQPTVSVIIPTLNERACIESLLVQLRAMCGAGDEIIVVDGGSADGTLNIARRLADCTLAEDPGRARQMNAGAAVARGEVLWFLHADTVPGPGALSGLRGSVMRGARWGRFRTRLSGRRAAFRVIERFMHWRALVTGIATGDQGIFARQEEFESVDGFPEIPLMEDVAISRRLRRLSRPTCCAGSLVTSSRRWEEGGVWRTVRLMWRLRFAYWRGADPDELARAYRSGSGDRP